MSLDIERVDPLDLDLGTATEITAMSAASNDTANLPFPPPAGPWPSSPGGTTPTPRTSAAPYIPMPDVAASAGHSSTEIFPLALAGGRDKVYTGAGEGAGGVDALRSLGFDSDGYGVNAVRRLDVHNIPRSRWDRVMARHRPSGEWAGMSMLCVDEFHPALAFQEDTSVVRAHRGHRLGLLMKAEMLRWVGHERPEIDEIDTWNSTANQHLISVNERLGTRLVARHLTFRWAG